MFKRIAITAAVSLIAVVGIGFMFRAPLLQAVTEKLTADMFVPADTDTFDPGIAIGTKLPALRALQAGREIRDLSTAMGSRGVLLFVNRSVDW